MAATDLSLTRADFDRCNWEAAIDQAEKRVSFYYSIQFRKRLQQAIEAGDSVAAAVFTVLFVATEVDLRPDNVYEPFGPQFVAQVSRGVGPFDLTDGHYAILAELSADVADPEMRSRLCDLVWLVKRNHQLARTAVDAYLESARALEDPVNWVGCIDRITRAVQIARSLGNGGIAELERAVAHIEALLHKLNGEQTGFMSCQLMELLQSVRKGDPRRYAELAEKTAKLAEAEGGDGLRRASYYWHCAADWHGIAKDASKREAALIAAAETLVKQADDVVAKPRGNSPNLTAAGQLERAVHALRKIGTPAALSRADALYIRMVDFQRKSVSELTRMEYSVDLTDLVRIVENELEGLNFDEALQRIAYFVTPAPKAVLREQILRHFGKSRLEGFFSCTTLSPTGKIVAERPHFESSGEAKEHAIIAEMYRQAVHRRGLVAQGSLVAAIQKLRLEHSVRLADFLRLTESSAFVPQGRELAFAKGLYAGFTGDLIISTHLLIPQIEESIRTHLAARGIITSGFSRQNLQNEYDLNTTLYLEGITQIFDEDALFDLRGLLVEHHGSNLRNMVMHGLLDDNQLQSDAALYLWGLTLRLCVTMLPKPGAELGDQLGPQHAEL
jgi:hypothetical protein